MAKYRRPKAGEPPRSWSYSAWENMNTCPRRYAYDRWDKLRGPAGNPAMIKGEKVHKEAEAYILGRDSYVLSVGEKQKTIPLKVGNGGVPLSLQKLRKHFQKLKDVDPIVEKFWSVSQSWKPQEYGWCVMKMDAAETPTRTNPVLAIIDFKTGREYEDKHEGQGSLYAAIGYAKYPQVKKVITEFWYVDGGYPTQYEYTLGDLKRNCAYWREEGERLMECDDFPATPTVDGCKYCAFRSDNQLNDGSRGPCGEWKKARS